MHVQDMSDLQALRHSDGGDPRVRAEKVAATFEQVLVQQMVQGLRKTVDAGDSQAGSLFGDGPGAQTYNDWFDLHLSRHLSESGGVGVADVLLADWERMGQIPPATTGGSDATGA